MVTASLYAVVAQRTSIPQKILYSDIPQHDTHQTPSMVKSNVEMVPREAIPTCEFGSFVQILDFRIWRTVQNFQKMSRIFGEVRNLKKDQTLSNKSKIFKKSVKTFQNAKFFKKYPGYISF